MRCSPVTRELTDVDRARRAFLRATNRLFALADPAARRADRGGGIAQHTTQARPCIDAFLTVYWAAMGKPEAARQSSKSLALEELPELVGAETAWALRSMSADAGRPRSRAAAQAGYAVATRLFDAPHLVNIADAHVGALLLAGRVEDASRWPNAGCRRPTVRAHLNLLGCRGRGPGRARCRPTSTRPAHSWSGGRWRCPPAQGLGWWYRYQIPLRLRWPCAVRPVRPQPRWPRSNAPLPVLDYECARPGMGRGSPGRCQRGDRDAVVGGRNRPGQWAVRGGGDVSADRHPVR